MIDNLIDWCLYLVSSDNKSGNGWNTNACRNFGGWDMGVWCVRASFADMRESELSFKQLPKVSCSVIIVSCSLLIARHGRAQGSSL